MISSYNELAMSRRYPGPFFRPFGARDRRGRGPEDRRQRPHPPHHVRVHRRRRPRRGAGERPPPRHRPQHAGRPGHLDARDHRGHRQRQGPRRRVRQPERRPGRLGRLLHRRRLRHLRHGPRDQHGGGPPGRDLDRPARPWTRRWRTRSRTTPPPISSPWPPSAAGTWPWPRTRSARACRTPRRRPSKGGLIDLVAEERRAISSRPSTGRPSSASTERTMTLALAGEPVVEVPMSFRQRFLLTISNPNLAYILLMIGLLGLYFEFANPGSHPAGRSGRHLPAPGHLLVPDPAHQLRGAPPHRPRHRPLHPRGQGPQLRHALDRRDRRHAHRVHDAHRFARPRAAAEPAAHHPRGRGDIARLHLPGHPRRQGPGPPRRSPAARA